MAEWRLGAGRGAASIAYVTVGTGGTGGLHRSFERGPELARYIVGPSHVEDAGLAGAFLLAAEALECPPHEEAKV